jgi:hypothetical protein
MKCCEGNTVCIIVDNFVMVYMLYNKTVKTLYSPGCYGAIRRYSNKHCNEHKAVEMKFSTEIYLFGTL